MSASAQNCPDRRSRIEQTVRVPDRRVPWDLDAYEGRVRSACFVCETVAGNDEYVHHVVARDATSIVFLAKYPWVRGHLIVAPLQHREQVITDFDRSEYLDLQAVLHSAGHALQKVVPTERLYVLSLGSQQGNSHTHWHLVPLPPGIPYRQQQLAFLSEGRGWLDMPHDEMARLAESISSVLQTHTAARTEL